MNLQQMWKQLLRIWTANWIEKCIYTNYFADIAQMILATAINAVLNIIDVDKTARSLHLTKI